VLAATVADDEITTAKLRKLAEAGAIGMPVRDKQGGPGKVFGWLVQLTETGDISYIKHLTDKHGPKRARVA
jgi:hypothetical protein